MTNAKRVAFIENFDFERLFKALGIIFIDPVKEIWLGIESNRFPFWMCSSITVLILVAHVFGIDYFVLKYFGLGFLYPSDNWFWIWLAHKFSLILSGYYLWGLYQTALKIKLTRRLTEVFTEAGLKSALGRLPAFIDDKPLDEDSRKLKLKLKGQSFKDFKQVKDRLEGSLQVHIDEIKLEVRSGTVDILYSYNELTNSYQYKQLPELGRDEFVVGVGRSRVIKEKLSNVPHILIAGQTGGGKSTFLRQLITSLYLKNKDYTFELIDLKGGLEFQLFEKLPRVNVITNIPKAVTVLEKHAGATISQRSKLFKHNKCKDIESFLKIPKDKRKYPAGIDSNINLGRKIIIIDEASEVFMVGAYSNPENTAKAKSYAAKIGSQGRALGVHLVIATQKPSIKSVDGQIKTHLTGRVCFRMSDIASSNTILDSKRAAELPNIKGRAIWRSDSELREIQAPNLDDEKAQSILSSEYITKGKFNSEKRGDYNGKV